MYERNKPPSITAQNDNAIVFHRISLKSGNARMDDCIPSETVTEVGTNRHRQQNGYTRGLHYISQKNGNGGVHHLIPPKK